MPKTQNSNNLSKEDVCKFYEFVCAFEKTYKHEFGSFDIDNPCVQKFCEDNDIALGKRPKRQFRFVFEAYKPKNKLQNDKAHHLLRHIRNSFCHGLVTKRGRFFTLKDYNKAGNLSMDAQIREDLLWSLLGEIVKTLRP